MGRHSVDRAEDRLCGGDTALLGTGTRGSSAGIHRGASRRGPFASLSPLPTGVLGLPQIGGTYPEATSCVPRSDQAARRELPRRCSHLIPHIASPPATTGYRIRKTALAMLLKVLHDQRLFRARDALGTSYLYPLRVTLIHEPPERALLLLQLRPQPAHPFGDLDVPGAADDRDRGVVLRHRAREPRPVGHVGHFRS
jgi:hypothetical protein